ncbi:MAG: AraC family transcriptional regulator [Bacteroidota bacterium]
MILKRFDTDKGVYAFLEEGLEAAVHQHPAAEVLLVRSGTVTVRAGEQEYADIKGCVLPPNIVHSVQGQNAYCEIWILEKNLASVEGQDLMPPTYSSGAIMILSEEETAHYDDTLLEKFQSLPALTVVNDQRVSACIKFIKENLVETALNRAMLGAKVHLSPSRLSHLFKTQTGTTLQNYIIWERLKCAISCSLNQGINLLNAAYQAGFYDAAHFSRAFQKMFGVNPSSAYNSSILQI